MSIYTENQYESYDLDFITRASLTSLGAALHPLGFQKVDGAREFRHPGTKYYVEFPLGPLAFGETVISDREARILDTKFGPIRIVSPTQSVMDRLAAFVHWNDRQSFDQAVLVGKVNELDWDTLIAWAEVEAADPSLLEKLRARIGGR